MIYIIVLPYDTGIFNFIDFSAYIKIQWFQSSITYNPILFSITFTINIILTQDEYDLLIDQIFLFGRLNNLFTSTNQLNINNLKLPIVPLFFKLHITSTDNVTSLTNGASLHVFGGGLINKDLEVGGSGTFFNGIDLKNSIITNVTSPNNSLDVTNKFYVDSRFDNLTTGNVNGNFTKGQVIIANTGGNITGYSTLIYNNDTNSLSLYGTQESTSMTDGGALSVYGGANIHKQLFVGDNTHILGYLDMNNQLITSVATPITFYDAANKFYVDNRFDNFTIGNIFGNFTQGQVLVAATNGNITGYDSFAFNSGLLSLSNTVNSTNLTTPGALIVHGGVNFLKTLFVGQGINVNNSIISNVTSPNTSLDVANKWYVDNTISNGFTTSNILATTLTTSYLYSTTSTIINLLGTNSSISSSVFNNITTGSIHINSSNMSANNSTGALVLKGGLGINGNLYANNFYTYLNTSAPSVALTPSPLTSKGDLYTFNTSGDRLPISTTGSILVSDSTQPTGLLWQLPTEIPGSFGSEYHFSSSTAASITTSLNYYIKTSLTTSNLLGGTYLISSNFTLSDNTANKAVQVRVLSNATGVSSGTLLLDCVNRPTLDTIITPFSNSVTRVLPSGIFTLGMIYRVTQTASLTISEASLQIHRIQ